MEIIGRGKERHILERCEGSGKPEFVAVYGRRRVGKTYLVAEHFGNRFAFSVTGTASGKKTDQLGEFYQALRKHYQGDIRPPKSWADAFRLLEEQIERDVTQGRKVLFFDELPWLDTPKSGFLTALEHFWNAFASRRPDIMLIVCGSAVSWMIRKLIDNYGGLHNRVTETIVVEPFTLGECEAFYRSRGIAYNRRQIAEAYMILGGIPYYMDAMDKMYGLNQNIDLLLFEKNAKLAREFDRLYHSLFRNAENHIRIVETLASHGSGITRQELSQKSGVSDGGGLTKALAELEECGLVSQSQDIIKRRNGEYYKCVDFFTLFYLKFLKGRKGTDPHFWTNYLTDPAHRGWCGYAFERLCMAHVPQIKQKLGIAGVVTEVYAFRSEQTKGGAQIDLLIDRKDDVINLCECKFTGSPYDFSESEAAELERKKEVFWRETGTKKAIHVTLIASGGVGTGPWKNDIQSVITLDDLFKDI
ncbi:MAG: AAA family ATPase [Lachnospiraceae bacterium]|jgi:hypothetical protein|nr:AAA family ATPase [Lachnospiraceae bacterium]